MQYPVELQLDMTKRTSQDKNLVVDVTLFNNCAAFSEESVKESKIISYYLNTTEVYIEGYVDDDMVIFLIKLYAFFSDIIHKR